MTIRDLSCFLVTVVCQEVRQWWLRMTFFPSCYSLQIVALYICCRCAVLFFYFASLYLIKCNHQRRVYSVILLWCDAWGYLLRLALEQLFLHYTTETCDGLAEVQWTWGMRRCLRSTTEPEDATRTTTQTQHWSNNRLSIYVEAVATVLLRRLCTDRSQTDLTERYKTSSAEPRRHSLTLTNSFHLCLTTTLFTVFFLFLLESETLISIYLDVFF